MAYRIGCFAFGAVGFLVAGRLKTIVMAAHTSVDAPFSFYSVCCDHRKLSLFKSIVGLT